MNLLQALEFVAGLIPGAGPAVRALRLLRIAVRIVELVRDRVRLAAVDADGSEVEERLGEALAELQREEAS